MILNIRKTNLQWSDALAEHIERRVHGALDSVPTRVPRVDIRISDINGPKGGDDKHCRISSRLTTGQQVAVDAVSDCPYRAVDQAVARFRRSVVDRAERVRDTRRRRYDRRWQPPRAAG